jgi:pseudouridine synthase
MRVNRILSLAGVTSRRRADEWIREGRIAVNGRIVREPGVQAVWGTDRIEVDGRAVPPPSPRIYLLLNKPFGYVCTLQDPEGRRVVTELLGGIKERVYPVGRLDFDSMGLLFLTNDGEWAHRLSHPSYEVPRTYKATVEGAVPEEAIKDLRKGVVLEDGPSGPAKVSVVSRNAGRSVLRITITTGRNRIVRRILEAVGHRVVHLLRTGFGPVELGDLKVGALRYLETEEVETLKRLVGMG